MLDARDVLILNLLFHAIVHVVVFLVFFFVYSVSVIRLCRNAVPSQQYCALTYSNLHRLASQPQQRNKLCALKQRWSSSATVSFADCLCVCVDVSFELHKATISCFSRTLESLSNIFAAAVVLRYRGGDCCQRHRSSRFPL